MESGVWPSTSIRANSFESGMFAQGYRLGERLLRRGAESSALEREGAFGEAVVLFGLRRWGV
jgi:hypothetical protein